ncbi:MAG: SRPBCC domain-containing protein [Actinomycetota bacterium]|nr:SRPBCC domain-containing protein [Actinomycetota bacterium]
MRAYEVSTDVQATPEAVWDVLTDGEAYPTWDSGIEAVEGTIGRGQRIKVRSAVNPGRAFPVTVTTFDRPHAMTWTGGLPLGLFKGVRRFTLSPSGNVTRFVMREEFSGPLLPLIWRNMPDLQPAFDTFASGLKARCEARTSW